jgi:hypothetical protein
MSEQRHPRSARLRPSALLLLPLAGLVALWLVLTVTDRIAASDPTHTVHAAPRR